MLGGILALETCQAQGQPPTPEPAPRSETTPVALPGKMDARSEFHIKYVSDGVVYLDGGRSAGLAEKMKLIVRRTLTGALPSGIAVAPGGDPGLVAEIEVYSVAENSAVCEVKSSTAPLLKGDIAALKAEDAQLSQILRNAGAGRHYAQTITFTEGDPIDEEARDYMPHPPLPEVNRIRARIEHGGDLDCRVAQIAQVAKLAFCFNAFGNHAHVQAMRHADINTTTIYTHMNDRLTNGAERYVKI